MASNTVQSTICVSSDINTRTKVDEDGSIHKQPVMSVPIYSDACQGCYNQGAISEHVCGSRSTVCDKQLTTKDLKSDQRVYCSCDLLGVPPPRYRQRNSTGVVCTRRRTNYRRSLSLPGSRKGLYDIVVSEDLLCVGHICDGPLQKQFKAQDTSERKHCHAVKQSMSYQDRDLVKMEIEMELANSVPDEFKHLRTDSTASEQNCDHLSGRNSNGTKASLSSKSDSPEVGQSLLPQGGGSTSSTPVSDTSEWSMDFTPNILCDEIRSRKRVGRSHSWTFSTNFMDLDSESSMSQDSILDFENGILHNKSKPVWVKRHNDGAVSGDFENGVARTRRRCRNVHATLSLNEQEIQALEEHLEQNVYVPVQLLIGSRGSRRRPPSEIPRPLFVLAEIVTDECCVCLATTLVRQRECCDAFVCDNCFKTYLTTMINQRLVTMQCPRFECKKYLSREEIAYHLDHATRDKFYRFILEANCEPHMKTCPRCNFLTTMDKELLAKKSLPTTDAKICCEQCDLEWCFPCHAPWHDGMTCKDFWKGDRLLKDWAKERHLGIVNAHRCPKCRVFIQRSSGCDHMTCSRCRTEFCYQCGERFRGIRYFGNHYSRYSIFGCKYRFKPEDPVERKVIRGAIFGCKVLAAPLCLGLAVGAGGLILTVGAIALPIYGGYKLHKRLTHQPQQPMRRMHYAQPFHGGFDPMDLEGYTLDPMDLIPRDATII